VWDTWADVVEWLEMEHNSEWLQWVAKKTDSHDKHHHHHMPLPPYLVHMVGGWMQ
jgi:hypothetical protein